MEPEWNQNGTRSLSDVCQTLVGAGAFLSEMEANLQIFTQKHCGIKKNA